jgi:hypothetical protein
MHPARTPHSRDAMAVSDSKQYSQFWISVKACMRVLYPLACHCADRLLSARKEGELMLHQNALLAARNHKLEEQLAVMIKQISCKRR